ncbi:MAG: hypothetical protein C0506_15735 [Anaerolinea sp.]|nr:hypothetical protein [Anaerolinea sp.]
MVVDGIERAAGERDWARALGWTDSVSKLEVFVTLAPEMTLEERRTTLAAIWTALPRLVASG